MGSTCFSLNAEVLEPQLPQVMFRGWYIDDAVAGDTALAMDQWLEALDCLGPAVGLHLKWSKCTVYGPAPPECTYLARCGRGVFEDLQVLNVPCSDNNVTFWSEHLEEVLARNKRYELFAPADPHSAYLLAKGCGGANLSTYVARCAPMPHETAEALDEAILKVWNACGPAFTGDNALRASLPVRMNGGLGLRPMSRVAPLALLCGLGVAQNSTQHFFSSPCPERALPPGLPTSILNNYAPDAASVVLKGIAASTQIGAERVKGLQKKAMHLHEQFLANELFAPSSPEEQARQQSCKHPRANYWLSPPSRAYDMCLLEPIEFDLAIRLRFGLPVQLSSCKAHCNRCHAPVSDRFGTHELACKGGPHRIELHDSLKNIAINFATQGGLNPTREPRPFANSSSDRLDMGFLHGGRMHLLDFAVTSHLRVDRLQAAIASPGGAATEHERIKRSRYGALICPGQALHPVIFDTLGAWGRSADNPLSFIANSFARRSCLGPSAAHLFYAKLNATIIRGVIRLLLATSTAGEVILTGG